MNSISTYCTSIPAELAQSLDAEFAKIQKHYLLSEFDDLLVDSGRMCEAILRYIEWRTNGAYTAIDGKNKPDRSRVVNAARQSKKLEPSLKQQAANLTESVMDFRNNRNAAHLGNIDPNIIDAFTAYQMMSWIMAELIRIEAKLDAKTIQNLINSFAERPIPVIYTVSGNPTVLDNNINNEDEVLVLLYDAKAPVELSVLFKWTHHGNVTRWRKNVIGTLVKQRLIIVERNVAHLLPTGSKLAESILSTAATV